MKAHFPLLYILVLFSACQSSDSNKNNTTAQTAIHEATPADAGSQGVIKGGIYIEKITDYSPQFVANLQNAAKNIQVSGMMGDRLVTDSGDTLQFPAAPPIGLELTFKGGQTGQEVELKLERVNQSTIRYAIVIALKEGGTYEMKSLADLSPLFFLGAESDEDDQTGLSYLASEFIDPASECNNSIRIGQTDDGLTYLAKLVMDCYDLPMSIDESPTLRAK